jgi:hypothetical protein
MNQPNPSSAADDTAAEDIELRLLRQQYSPIGAFLAPVLRYAYRSGSTQVDMTWQDEPALLTIECDGRGIELFDKLLNIGAKSWKLATLRHQHGFALALAALLCAAERLEIVSGALSLAVDSERFLMGGGAVRNSRPSTLPGLRLQIWMRAEQCPQSISLIEDGIPSKAQAWERILSSLTCGFSARVIFNGRSLPQTAGGGLDSYTHLTCGWIHAGTDNGLGTLPALFYEGLPIRNGQKEHNYMVLHLDPHVFQLNPLAQDELIEHRRQLQRIAIEVDEFRRKELQRARHSFGPELFVNFHWQRCVTLGLPELLAGTPLTATMLYRFRTPVTASIFSKRYCDEWESRPVPADTDLLVREIGHRHFHADGKSCAPLASLFAQRHGLAILKDVVPKEHPAHQRCFDLLDPYLRFGCEIEGAQEPVEFTGGQGSLQVQRCRAYSIYCIVEPGCSLPPEVRAKLRQLQPVRITDQTIYDFANGRILHPAESTDLGVGLLQAHPYEHKQQYRGDWYARDLKQMQRQLQVA